MKEITTLVLLVLTTQITAQTVSYKTKLDDPFASKKLTVDIAGYSGLGVGLKDNMQSYVSFGYEIGASYFPIMNKIEIRSNYQTGQDLIDDNKYSKFELTCSYSLISKAKTKDRQLILSQSSTTYSTTTKSIQTPQTRQTNMEVKGGIVFNNGYLGYLKENGSSFSGSSSITYQAKGLVAGIQLRQFYSYAALINNKYTVKSSGSLVAYADIMIMPISGYKMKPWPKQEVLKIDKSTKDRLKDAQLTTPIGGKMGVRFVNNKHKLFSYYAGTEIGILAPNKVIHGSFLLGMSLNFM
ncbi:MAG: hypothetical protein COA58_01225 [Bacteroidetes bacterium]|nr:MAG: hypothetical protein COA58_01225 [Bacteroidota bacterium]